MTAGILVAIQSLLPMRSISLGIMLTGCLCVVLEIFGADRSFPQLRRQVSRRWLHGSRMRAATIFGGELGTGWMTWNRHPASYAIVLAVVLFGSPVVIVIGAIGFGISRALPTLVTAFTALPVAGLEAYEHRRITVRRSASSRLLMAIFAQLALICALLKAI